MQLRHAHNYKHTCFLALEFNNCVCIYENRICLFSLLYSESYTYLLCLIQTSTPCNNPSKSMKLVKGNQKLNSFLLPQYDANIVFKLLAILIFEMYPLHGLVSIKISMFYHINICHLLRSNVLFRNFSYSTL